MNPISPQLRTGTIGELLVQIRLLQYGVQAAPPLKDSGNDLIAVKEEVFKAIQVKSTRTACFSKQDLPEFYHILAVVQLKDGDNGIELDKSEVFLIPKNDVHGLPLQISNLDRRYKITQLNVDNLFDARRCRR